MKILIPIFCVVSLVIAEPPVGDSYPAARSSHDDHNYNDHHASNLERSLSLDYGLPSFATSRNAPSAEYGAPNARSVQNSRGQLQRNSPPSARVSFNQRFRSPALRSSQDNTPAVKSLSQEHRISNARSGISQDYGLPNSRSLAQEYGVPSIVSARTLSTEYRRSEARSTPSQEYGVPVIAARSIDKSHSQAPSFRSAQSATASRQSYSTSSTRSQFPTHSLFTSSSDFIAPSTRSNEISQGYDAPIQSARSSFGSRSLSQTESSLRSAPSSTYSTPSSRSLSPTYGIPSARDSDAYSQDINSVSSSYGVPSQTDLSDAYEVPSARRLSQEYGVPSSRVNLKTSAVTSPYPAASSRSSPSSTYLPASRTASPSEQYGVPEQRDSQGYDYAKARALEELQSQEPASYDFAYQIEDVESGSDFGHTETREENRAEGSYFVVLPDGTKQTVEYEADERGYKPRISSEPIATGAWGYDENAAEIRSAEDGPY